MYGYQTEDKASYVRKQEINMKVIIKCMFTRVSCSISGTEVWDTSTLDCLAFLPS